MDIRMPNTNGLAATTTICTDPDLSATRVLILTTFETDEYVARPSARAPAASSARTSPPTHCSTASAPSPPATPSCPPRPPEP